MDEDSWITLGIVLQCDSGTAREVMDLLQMVPGVTIVYKRVSPRRLYVTDEAPQRRERR
jgi:hypothetical protein